MSDLPNPWFGKLKSRWPVVPIRSAAKLGTGHTPSRSVPEYWENCTIPWVTVEDIRREGEWAMTPLLETEQHISELGLANSAAVLHPAGTVMLSRTASIGLSCIVGRPMATTQAFVTWTPKDEVLDGEYLLAALKAMSQQFEYLAYGATHLTIYFPDISVLRIPLPPRDVQAAVVAFIKRETAKIDALIAEQQRLIELLQEKRQAVISHAVTKGLNPDAPMKDSGIEWLGEVPEHWEIAPLRRLTAPGTTITYGIVQAGPDTEGGIPYIRTSDMAGDELPETGYLRTTPEIDRSYARSKVQPNDLIVAIRATLGKGLLVPDFLAGANLTQGTARVSPGEKLLPRFLLRAFNSEFCQTCIDMVAKGTTFREITLDALRRIPLIVPPLSEQRDIVAFLDTATRRADELIADTSLAITLLQERRSALISAAVTGQIDVRGLAGSEAA